MSSRITRRDAAIRLVTRSALLWGAPFPLFAQQEQDIALLEAIATAITHGERLRTEIVTGAIPVSPWAGQVVDSELAHRRNLLQAFEVASPEDVSVYVREGFMPVYEFVRAADAPVIPWANDVQNSRIDISCRDATSPQESVGTILADIVLEALGISVEQNLFQQFLAQEASAREAFQRLTEAISTQQWSKVAELIDKLLWWLVVGGGAGNLIRFLWQHEVAADGFRYSIGLRLGLRFVPILGWLYLSGAIVLAIKANFHRFSGNTAHGGCGPG